MMYNIPYVGICQPELLILFIGKIKCNILRPDNCLIQQKEADKCSSLLVKIIFFL